MLLVLVLVHLAWEGWISLPQILPLGFFSITKTNETITTMTRPFHNDNILISEDGLLLDIGRLDPLRKHYEQEQHSNSHQAQDSKRATFVSKYCDLQGMTMEEWYPPNDMTRKRVPHFVIIGAKKAGTTSLFTLLQQHPQIVPPKRKEWLFFLPQQFRKRFVSSYNDKVLVQQARDVLYNPDDTTNHYINWDSELSHSSSSSSNYTITFDATPGYIFHSALSAQYALCVCPWIKIIVLLRDPIDRLWSHYNFFKSKRKDGRPIQNSVEDWIHHDLLQLQKYHLISTSASTSLLLHTQRNHHPSKKSSHDRTNPTSSRPTSTTSSSTTSSSLSTTSNWKQQSIRSTTQLEEYVQWLWGNYTIATTGSKSGPTGEGSLGRGIYSIQLRHWFNAMIDMGRSPKENILIIRTQDLSQQPQIVYNHIIQWFNLSTHVLSPKSIETFPTMKTNYTKNGIQYLNTTTKQLLQQFYQPFNQQLAQLLQDEKWQSSLSSTWKYNNNNNDNNNQKTSSSIKQATTGHTTSSDIHGNEESVLLWPPPV